ncbi:MAG: response regulator [Chloroflexi bacterium]|nr:response regulator [Chloroflexota bacterium]
MATKSILVVEPDEAISSLIALVLEEEDYDITAVDSLTEASQLLREAHFDLVITEAFDQADPYSFDSSFIERIKDTDYTTPIILVSKLPSVDYLPAEQYGLSAVLSKPFEIEDLLAKVRAALNGGLLSGNGSRK